MGLFVDWKSDLEPFARNALQQAGYSTPYQPIDVFLLNIEASISAYLTRSIEDQSARKAHDRLRKLLNLVNDSDPPIGLIRKHIKSLPEPAKGWLLRRGSALWLDLVGGEFSEAVFDKWVQLSEPLELLRVLKSLVSEGGMMLDGRKDRRPKKIFEPMIMGVIRGTGKGLSDGGRPKASAHDELVMHLAIDWTNATGEQPQKKRSDSEGFSGLVHQIFNSLGVEDTQGNNNTNKVNHAEQALRRFWAAVANGGYAPVRKQRSNPHPKSTGPKRGMEP